MMRPRRMYPGSLLLEKMGDRDEVWDTERVSGGAA